MRTHGLRFRCGGWALLATTLLLCPDLPAQVPTARRFIDSLFDEIGRANTSAELPSTARCVGRSGTLGRLCNGLIADRRIEFSKDRGDAARTRDLFERIVAEEPTWPVGWYGLGVARLQASRAGVLAHEGPLHPVGMSNEVGAGNALVHALELDSNFLAAAEVLAVVPIPREGGSRLGNRVQMLRRVKRLLPTFGRYSAGMVELEGGDPDSAAMFFKSALARRDVDSGVVLLQLARALHWSGKPAEGRGALLAGARDTATIGQTAYRKELEWVASPAELAEWDSLPVAKRSNWLASFWADRDVEEGHAEGERLVEHYRRVKYALNAYRLRLPQVGRQLAAGVAVAWDFYDEEQYVKGLSRQLPAPNTTHDGSYHDLDAATGRNTIVANIALASGDVESIGHHNPFRSFRASQDILDDRGVVYIRQGKPDATAQTTQGESLMLWVYHRDGNPLVLSFREVNFDGQVGASQLTPTLITANPILRDQLCHLDASICSSNAAPSPYSYADFGSLAGANLNTTLPRTPTQQLPGDPATQQRTVQNAAALASGAKLHRLRDEGLAAIDTATQTDRYRPPLARAMTPSVVMYGLDRAQAKGPLVIAAFAIPGEQLTPLPVNNANGRPVYPVRVRVLTARLSDGTRADLDTTRYFATAKPLAKGEYLTGLAELPVSPGRYSATLMLTQPDSGGSVAHLPALMVPGNARQLTVSDLVLGREGSGVHWNSGATVVPLNPLNVYSRDGGAEVYFQLSGLEPGSSYETRFDFFRSDDDVKHAPRLTISSTQLSGSQWTEMQRTLGLRNLDVGRYRVQLTVRSNGKTAMSTAWVTIVK